MPLTPWQIAVNAVTKRDKPAAMRAPRKALPAPGIVQEQRGKFVKTVGKDRVDNFTGGMTRIRAGAIVARGSKGVILASGVGKVLGTANVADTVVLMRAAVSSKALTGARVSAIRTYERTMGKVKEPPYPVTGDKVITYLTRFVLVDTFSSGSLDTKLSNLRVAMTTCGKWEVTEEGAEEIRAMVGYLQDSAPCVVKGSRALREREVVQLFGWLKTQPDTTATRRARGLCAAAIFFQLRMTELVGDRGMRLLDVFKERLGKGMGYRAWFAKNRGGTQRVVPSLRVAPALPPQFASVCITKQLGEYLTRDRAWVGEEMGARNTAVFCTIGADGQSTDKPLGAGEAWGIIQWALRGAGISEWKEVDQHFGRPSGWNFYRWVLLLAKPVVDEAGDWAAVRDTTTGTSYNRGTIRDLVTMIAKATAKEWCTVQ
jgi:hypothetical protein